MKTFLALLVLLVPVSVVMECTHATEPEKNEEVWTFEYEKMDIVIDPEFKDLVAFVGQFPREGGSFIDSIFLMDYYDHSDYEALPYESAYIVDLWFSPDKSKLLFTDATLGIADGGSQYILYDLREKTVTLLEQTVNGDLGKAVGEMAVWNPDNSGFYSTGYFFSRYYKFSDKSFDPYSIRKDNGEYVGGYVLDLIDPNTLIAFSRPDYILADVNGTYIDSIRNPHLTMESAGLYSIDWSNELGLFAFAKEIPGTNKREIITTNLDGTYFRKLTSPVFWDYRPVWGPEGETIVFTRRQWISDGILHHEVLEIVRATGEVRSFMDPVKVGAIQIKNPAY